ncbi:MAG: hypothetical protein NUV50_00275 [Rhodospirillales bacterium]|nr:hypothetical protein [Rhodospirillales bacterium]
MSDNNKIMEIPKSTRFRAYQLGTAGASYSYYCGEIFTLVEARLTDASRDSVVEEMKICGKDQIDVLHITSWDQDHCAPEQLKEICETHKPKKIQYPGYKPETDSGKDSLKYIQAYKKVQAVNVVSITPEHIDALPTAADLTYRDIYYGPKAISDNHNDNSTVKLFRSGSFSVLSMGDVEDDNIGSRIRRNKIIQRESDVLILPHHGADNGLSMNAFLKHVKPKLAVCCVNYDNQYDHPAEATSAALKKHNVDCFTTKTGDVIIESFGHHNRFFKITNLIAGNDKVSLSKTYKTKRGSLFEMGRDALKNLRRGNKKY